MAELTCNVITKEFDPQNMIYNSVISAETSETYNTKFDCKGPMELIVDASSSEEDITITIDRNMVASPDSIPYECEIPAGYVQMFSITSGQVSVEGDVWITVSAESALTALGVKLGVIKRRYVTNH